MEEAGAVDFVERLLNADLSLVTPEMVLVNTYTDQRDTSIIVETKGLLERDHIFFRSKKITDPTTQTTELFEAECFLQWKLRFINANRDYVAHLLQKKLIGFRHVNQKPL